MNTLKWVLLPLVGVALAARAQALLNTPGATLGGILYACAVVAFVVAFRTVKASRFAQDRSSEAPAEPPRLSRNSLILLIVATVLAAGGLILFTKDATAGAAWFLYLLSVVVFAVAIKPFETWNVPFGLSPGQIRRALLRALPIMVILAVAAFARLWQLDHFPFGTWYDEADNGLQALRIMNEPAYRPIYDGSAQLPAHYIYLIVLAFRLFGVSTYSMRLVNVAFGILTVLFAYLLFRRWFGEVVGLVAATMMAVLRYDITFSRFGLFGVTAPAFELAALYFLDRALARKALADFAWFGLSVGFGLAFYAAFRLFPIALAVFLIGMLIAAAVATGIRRAFSVHLRGLFVHWMIAAFACLLAIAPVAEYALLHTQDFFARSATVSIFQKRDQPDLGKALWSNTVKHLEMFNVRGDNNGRHNLPGAPMLDPVMGVLFMLGVPLALWRWRDPANSLMLLVFAFMLLAGIFSLDFEAPQSERAIGVIPAVVYLAALPIAALEQLLLRIFRRDEDRPALKIPAWLWSWRLGLFASALVILLAVITYLNFHTFFVQQQNDPSAWAAYSTSETVVANELKRYAGTHDLVLTAMYDGSPTVQFLAGNVSNVQRWTQTDHLPLIPQDSGRGVVMMFDEKLLPTYHDAQQLYPNAKFTEFRAPGGSNIVLYEAVIEASDLQAVQGVDVRYFSGEAPAGQPIKREVLQQAAVDWTEGFPVPTPFIAELRSTLDIPKYGTYRFAIQDNPSARLWIDENPISDSQVTLARGTHTLRMEIPGSSNRAELLWQTPDAVQFQPVPAANLFRAPVSNSGLLGAYYPTPDWSGPPAFTQVDPEIAVYFHIIPLQRPYSVEWTGKLFAPTQGSYGFSLYSIDGSWLKIDNSSVVENPTGVQTVQGSANLAQGWHDITIRFQDRTGGTQIYLYWTPPGATQPELLPSRFLSPPMGQLPASP